MIASARAMSMSSRRQTPSMTRVMPTSLVCRSAVVGSAAILPRPADPGTRFSVPSSCAHPTFGRTMCQGRLSINRAIIEHDHTDGYRSRDRHHGRRPQLHDLARARARGDPRVLAREAAHDDRAAQPEDRHPARRRAPLPVHAGAARLRRLRGRAEFRPPSQAARPRPRVPLVDAARRHRAAVPRPGQRRGERVVLARDPRRRRHPLRRALAHLADHLGQPERGEPPARRTAPRSATCCSRICR